MSITPAQIRKLEREVQCLLDGRPADAPRRPFDLSELSFETRVRWLEEVRKLKESSGWNARRHLPGERFTYAFGQLSLELKMRMVEEIRASRAAGVVRGSNGGE